MSEETKSMDGESKNNPEMQQNRKLKKRMRK